MEMMAKANAPYTVEPLTDRRVVVRFSKICDHARLASHKRELDEVIEKYNSIAFDLSKTKQMSSDWIRFLAVLAQKAKRAGKTCAVARMNKILSDTTDVLGLKKRMVHVSSIEEVWKL